MPAEVRSSDGRRLKAEARLPGAEGSRYVRSGCDRQEFPHTAMSPACLQPKGAPYYLVPTKDAAKFVTCRVFALSAEGEGFEPSMDRYGP